ncbi:hypothetical protein PN488_21215 [Nodularia spumigena CS-591/12]|uniref:hypothetical protein n=1 Tax=Nodularia spumigena TaxID=70799 RepID=UPI00232C099F|nr:hypothetical protein [Nodularia spumigena]MDB9306857.1 hypothetical protein [Nodularia spumigena CS-591/12]MDB9342256.1 hypothetical protein [Nodularia spumigena CS-588/06]MDB9346944.1 hypothetical protein [Nodularia spumigena CS-588/01]MDB9350896.1 hypothetical protein [Nodularia spumigena CS-588/05]MDB9367597.1 hypothetical protein [Nodularia spumigena CS-586/05]
MSINKNKPHLFILPEDDDNKDIANGFLLDLNLNHRAIQVLPVAGGWMKVVHKFTNDHIKPMRDYPHRNIVLIIDFDGFKDRFSYVESFIPDDIRNRVFILGVKLEPKDLRRDTQKTCEAIGEALAKDCSENKNELWGHPLLIHNQTELERMIVSVKPFLFAK